MSGFGARLVAALAQRDPVCVGIDPHATLLDAWGLSDDAAGLERFARLCVQGFAGRVAAVKPQSAFFERHGSAGIAVLERTVAALREAGTLVVLDAKRGDIGSTMAAYADAYLDPASPLAVDALTVSPYLGAGSLSPALEMAARHDAGLFVLALTSNPEAASVQRARTSDGRSVAAAVAEDIAVYNTGARPLGSFGLVIGATIDDLDLDVRAFNGPVLMPGIGAQGASAADVRRLVGDAANVVLASASREVLGAGPDPAALGRAAQAFGDQVRVVRGG